MYTHTHISQGIMGEYFTHFKEHLVHMYRTSRSFVYIHVDVIKGGRGVGRREGGREGETGGGRVEGGRSLHRGASRMSSLPQRMDSGSVFDISSSIVYNECVIKEGFFYTSFLLSPRHFEPGTYCTHVYTSTYYNISIKNEVGCRDDTVPKTVDTRRHCEEE